METIELANGGILIHDEVFLPVDIADLYFTELRDHSAWEQKPGVFGHMQPQLTASYGDEGITYRYSGTVNVALPWTPTLLEIKQKIETVQGHYREEIRPSHQKAVPRSSPRICLRQALFQCGKRGQGNEVAGKGVLREND